MIYLARIPKRVQGYVIGIGLCLIMLMQEKDSFSFKYALIPVIFNNLLLIVSSCVMGGPVYVNNRCVVFGAFWYLFSIVFFLASFYRAVDLFYLFDDGFMLCTGFQLYYSWQTFEKNDWTFGDFLKAQWGVWGSIKSLMDQDGQTVDLKEKYERHLEKQRLKSKKYSGVPRGDEEEEGTLLRSVEGSTGSEV